jgi:hypothetical protein
MLGRQVKIGLWHPLANALYGHYETAQPAEKQATTFTKSPFPPKHHNHPRLPLLYSSRNSAA